MSKNKILAVAGTAVATLALLASFAAAETNNQQTDAVKPAANETKMSVQINASGHAQLTGTVAAVQSGSFTVTSWGGVWTVNVGADAKLARRFGGASNLSEFQAGDSVNVNGSVNQAAVWTIDAKVVKNNSIQAKNASFSGTISGLNGGAFSLTTQNRGVVSVSVNSDAKVYVNGQSSSVSGLANGMTAQVSGVWDRKQSTVMASRVVARTPRTTGNETSTRQ